MHLIRLQATTEQLSHTPIHTHTHTHFWRNGSIPRYFKRATKKRILEKEGLMVCEQRKRRNVKLESATTTTVESRFCPAPTLHVTPDLPGGFHSKELMERLIPKLQWGSTKSKNLWWISPGLIPETLERAAQQSYIIRV